ncbi:hypothetical protein Q31a_43500 [Aureliella helgolandensis]|uniref:Uncharacterized protein n=2 Tax=Aureliella helgolandensis TaxID=2527968 RepID=A0A518GBT0_9BACT|nr:hypothetical protein Q31a_43500 [Aureliella helgolandensis]
MVRALQKACSGDCSSPFTCQGCGSCEVESPAGRCGCCSGHSDVGSVEESNEESASCCGHGSATEQGIESTSEVDPFADTEMANEPLADGSPLRCSDDQLATTANSPLMVSGCRCLHAPEVPYAPAPRSPANEVRDLVSLGFASSDIAEPKQQLPRVPAFDSGPPSAILHFAQIELCVWRL